MKCPNDNSVLVMSDRSGIEIDYCPECRGVWLDRGELDKIIERSSSSAQPAVPPMPQQAPSYSERQSEKRYDDYDKGHHKKRKKEGFLGDIFDF